jgi:hypothetical protein
LRLLSRLYLRGRSELVLTTLCRLLPLLLLSGIGSCGKITRRWHTIR